MTDSLIKWLSIRELPKTPGTRITVKDHNGELFNVTVDRQGRINFAAHELRGWIPNDQ